ncbi:MAG: hypothetical protein V3S06_04255, partial [candidate division Zixibacteria bacterium]
MTDLKRHPAIAVVLMLILMLSCGDTGVTPRDEPTNEDAIYNIIRYDRPSEFKIDLLDFSVPETSLVQAGPIVPAYYWLNLDGDSLFIAIDINYPQPGDPIGINATAEVRLLKHFFGTFEVIGVDTSGGNQTPVRMSKEFTILGVIEADFEKFGADYNTRRGWLLTEISDAVYIGNISGPQGAIGSITISSISNPDHIIDTDIKPLSDVLRFSPGESLTVSITAADTGDFISLRYRSGSDFRSIPITPNSEGEYIAGFRVSGSEGYDHFLIKAINNDAVTDTASFQHKAIGV